LRYTARIANGKLSGLVASDEWVEALETCATQTGAPDLERCEILGVELLIKRSKLHGKSARRHGLRSLFGFPAPRLAEFQNLTWLRERLFLAPRPLFAGVVSRAGVPQFQYLATEYLHGATTLHEHLVEETEHEQVLATLAREVARMHALGFVHRDLYPRNLLVRAETVTFVDAWRGGAGPGLRGPEYDLACLMLYGSEWLERQEQSRFFADYFAERVIQERAVSDPAKFALAVEGNRTRLRNRLVKRPHERRGRELPSADWQVPFDR